MDESDSDSPLLPALLTRDTFESVAFKQACETESFTVEELLLPEEMERSAAKLKKLLDEKRINEEEYWHKAQKLFGADCSDVDDEIEKLKGRRDKVLMIVLKTMEDLLKASTLVDTATRPACIDLKTFCDPYFEKACKAEMIELDDLRRYDKALHNFERQLRLVSESRISKETFALRLQSLFHVNSEDFAKKLLQEMKSQQDFWIGRILKSMEEIKAKESREAELKERSQTKPVPTYDPVAALQSKAEQAKLREEAKLDRILNLKRMRLEQLLIESGLIRHVSEVSNQGLPIDDREINLLESNDPENPLISKVEAAEARRKLFWSKKAELQQSRRSADVDPNHSAKFEEMQTRQKKKWDEAAARLEAQQLIVKQRSQYIAAKRLEKERFISLRLERMHKHQNEGAASKRHENNELLQEISKVSAESKARLHKSCAKKRDIEAKLDQILSGVQGGGALRFNEALLKRLGVDLGRVKGAIQEQASRFCVTKDRVAVPPLDELGYVPKRPESAPASASAAAALKAQADPELANALGEKRPVSALVRGKAPANLKPSNARSLGPKPKRPMTASPRLQPARSSASPHLPSQADADIETMKRGQSEQLYQIVLAERAVEQQRVQMLRAIQPRSKPYLNRLFEREREEAMERIMAAAAEHEMLLLHGMASRASGGLVAAARLGFKPG